MPPRSPRAALALPALVLAATVVQLLVATLAGDDLPQFSGKAFAARLALYPLLMLLVPALWWLHRRRSARGAAVPVAGSTLVMAPFLLDVTGNSLDLYDAVVWWDDALHLVNWLLLSLGLALVLRVRELRPAWVRPVVVVGGGALLALVWEVGEWWTFIRHGTELGTAYEDTLADMVLGTSGSAAAALLLPRLPLRASAPAAIR